MLAGFRVGPYEIAAPATIPGAWQWYLARRVAAVRRLPSEAFVAMSPDDAALLQAGFEVLRRLEDARIPDAIAFYEGLGAMVVAAPTGPFLDELVMRRRGERIAMTPATLLDVGLELADVLCHAHRRGVYHGGLWPGRVAVAMDGGIVVWGFEEVRPTAPPAWMAPEVTRGPSVGAWTDQWSLAAILGALVSGSAPWTADEGRDLSAWLAPLDLQWPALARAIRRAMSADPQDRYPTLESFREELLALSRKAGGASERAHLGRRLIAAVQRPEGSPVEPLELRTEEYTRSDDAPRGTPLVSGAPPVRARPRARPLIPTDDPTESLESAPTEQIAMPLVATRIPLDAPAPSVIPLASALPTLPTPSAPAEPSMKYPTRPTLRLAEPSPFPEADGAHTDPDASPVEPAALLARVAISRSDDAATAEAATPRFAVPRANPTLEPRISMPTINLGPVPPSRPVRVDVELEEEPLLPDVTQEEEPELLLSTIDLVEDPYHYPNPTVVPMEGADEASDPAITSFDLGLDGLPRIQDEEDALELRIPPRRVAPITQLAPWAAGVMLLAMTVLTFYNVTH